MTNLEIIQELYRAFREKDYAAFHQICASDLEWIQNVRRYQADLGCNGVMKLSKRRS